jgi:DNA repair photolyase
VSRRAEFIPYRPKNILNKSKRPDHWFWTRYSANPYIGCQHGCDFCYCRERKFCPYDDIEDFQYVIKVKENAADLLRKALSRAPVELVFTGDYQPLERKFGLSRKMLEVCCDLGFPVFVLERSPLVLRDLDVLTAIHEKARAAVVFSIIYTPDSPRAEAVRQMEHLAPAVEKRFEAMEKIAAAGILTGTCFMPVLPGLCDDEANIENVARWTADHGGKFVLAGGLTLSDQQSGHYLGALQRIAPDLAGLYASLYPEGSYGAAGARWGNTARRVREMCSKYGISDRIPRPIIPGDKRMLNRQIVEIYANQAYTLELENAPAQRIWAYRKAAWAVEDLEQDIRLVYQSMGLKGLQSIPDVGPGLAGELEGLVVTPA